MLETVMLALSYPLRLMATHISVAFLKFVGVEVVAERTSINILAEGREIAVTDACSGMFKQWSVGKSGNSVVGDSVS